ncbi:zinc-binding alcohol dehydrogenase family protein [Streptomyces sp. NPDC056160]|uniref:quinone oxidoreductase family protein n=1 Tax=Streptomyces sp. NPDC056160 TaxID=3345731 RepID=UPI0035DA61C3
MEAVVVQESGELSVRDVPRPVPGPGQVLVQVEAMGIGYVDVMALRGDYGGFPGVGAVPGMEIAGRVTALGPDVPEEMVGRRVFALLPRFGGFARLAVADVGQVLPAAADWSARDTVALGINALVAETALERAGVSAGERVLIRGAGGGIGVLATQIARARGAEVTAVTSSEVRGELLRSLGAAHLLDRTAAAATLPESAYDIVVDTVTGPDLGRYLGLLRPNGRYVLCGAAGGPPGPDAFAPLLRDFHRSPALFAHSLRSATAEELARSWERIEALRAAGHLSAVIDRTHPLAEAARAVAHVAEGRPFGKVVLMSR